MGTDVVAETKMMKGIRVVVTADIDIERAIAAYKIAQIEGEVVVAETAGTSRCGCCGWETRGRP